MLINIFTVYDSKAAAYLPPFYEQSIGSALRSFGDTCKNEEHVFNKHSEDFTLFHLGVFDDQTCKFELLDALTSLGLASEYTNHPIPFEKLSGE